LPRRPWYNPPELAHSTPDDGFHEIQLNGKQLVFLFMAATVVSVVIFLCGVLVGRGVRAERGGAVDQAATNEPVSADIAPTQPPATPVPPVPAVPNVQPPPASDPRTAAPPTPVEDLSVAKGLEEGKQQADEPRPGPAAAAPAKSANAPIAQPSDVQTVAQGYAVQIAALNVRSEADAIAKRLSSKGYAAYVSANGTPAIYRVRIGTFKTRHEADTVAEKLQKEEQLKPWVTR
jgi:DedD protein